MAKLKSIVPSLELCKQIPSGEFTESALVWHFSQLANMGIFQREPWNERNAISAPTLEEIMREIYRLDYNMRFYGGITVSEALKIWFELKGFEVK